MKKKAKTKPVKKKKTKLAKKKKSADISSTVHEDMKKRTMPMIDDHGPFVP